MTDQEFTEYSQWMWADALKQLLQGVIIYAIVLTAYWGFIA